MAKDHITQLKIKEFEKFLKKQRKSNGDLLVDSTIQCYIDNISRHWSALSFLFDEKALFKYLESELKNRQNEVLFAAVKMFLRFRGFDEEIVSKLKFDKQKRAKAETSKRYLQSKILSAREISVLFRSCKDLQLKCIISALYDTGCRRNEIMSAKFNQLEVMKKNKHKKERSEGIYAKLSVMGKGRKTRIVYFGKTTFKSLFELWKGRKPKITDNLFCFLTALNQPYKKQDERLYKLIVEMGKKLLNREITPHFFRHTKATHLANSGARAQDIMGYLGHENIEVTMKYIKISETMGKNAFKGYSVDVSDL